MALLASAGFATLTLIGSVPVTGLDDETVTGLGFTAGGLALLPLAAVAGLAFRPTLAAFGWLAALATGPDRGGLHAVLPRPARGAREHGRAAFAARAAHGDAAERGFLGNRLSPAGMAGAALLAAAVALSVTGHRGGAAGRAGQWRQRGRCASRHAARATGTPSERPARWRDRHPLARPGWQLRLGMAGA